MLHKAGFLFLECALLLSTSGLGTHDRLAWTVPHPTVDIHEPFTSFGAQVKYPFCRVSLSVLSSKDTALIIRNCLFTTDAIWSAPLF